MNAQNHNELRFAKLSSIIFPTRYNVNKILFTILFSLYLALSLIRFMRPGFLITLVILWLGLFAFILLIRRVRRGDVSIYIFTGLLVTSFFISSLFVSRSEEIPRIFLHIVSCAGMAMILLRGYVYSWGGYIIFYGFSVYFLMLMFTGVDAHYALTFTSWNGISMVMLTACISLYIILSMENKKINLNPALLTLLISTWGIGRSGIISSFVLLLGLLSIRLRAKPKHIYIVIICLFIVYLFREAFFGFALDYLKIGNTIELYAARKGDYLAGRKEIWVNYFNNLDMFRIIFGANVFTDPWSNKEFLGYNYHNSFIALHSKTGFMGLIAMALIIFSLSKYYRANKVFFFLFLTIILRSSTDMLLFFETFDFIPFFFIFYFLRDFHFRAPHFLYPLQPMNRPRIG